MATSLPSSYSPRKRRKGGKLFSGCNTCRVRKIKCDEGLPTCSNCERSRSYICDGYGRGGDAISANLGAESTTQPGPERMPTATQRMSVLGGNELLNLDSDSTDLTRMFYNYTVACPGWSDQFAVGVSPRQTASDSVPDDIPSMRNGLLELHNDFSFVEGMLPFVQGDPIASPSCSQAQGISQPVGGRDQPHVMTLQSFRSSPHPPSTKEAEIEGFRMSKNTNRLLHHYQTHVCQLMMPTSAPSHNPWLRLYLPIALQEPATIAKKCLLFAILAVAAFNKAELSSAKRVKLRRQAMEYRKSSWEMLKDYVDSEAGRVDVGQGAIDRQALLAAALTMTTTEVFSGGNEGKGYESLLLAERIIQTTGGLSWWLSDTASATLLQIFRCLQIIALTSGWTNPHSLILEDTDSSSGDSIGSSETSPYTSLFEPEFSSVGQSLPCEYTLDVSFGISMKTLRCLNKIAELSTIKAKLSEPGTQWSQPNITELAQLEAELFDVFDDPNAFNGQPDFDALQQEGISNYVSEEIKENHIWAFHYSTAIFFKRAICDGGSEVSPRLPDAHASPDQATPRISGQALVSKALEHLENVDALSSDIAIANTLWPGFIAAVEAVDMELRHRSLIWFARAKRHGIGNIAKAKALVMEVWRRVDRQIWVSPGHKNERSELSHVDWRAVMKEKGMYIMLT